MPSDKTTGFDSNVIIEDPIGTPAAPGPYLGFARTDPGVQSTGPRLIPLTVSPNGVLVAPIGSLALVQDGTLWINTAGTDAWSQLSTGGGGGTSGNVVMFRPGGVAGGAIYTTWATTYAALLALVASVGTANVYVDTSVAPATVPAGTYNVLNVHWYAVANVLTSIDVTLAAGVILQNWNDLNGLVFIANNTVTPVFTAPANALFNLTHSQIYNNGTQPVVQVAANNSMYLYLRDEASINLLGAAATINLQANTQLSIFADGFSTVESNTISGAASAFLDLELFDSASIISLTQAAYAGGGLALALLASAANENYTPNNSVDWNGVDPPTVAAALDRIAAALGPIV